MEHLAKTSFAVGYNDGIDEVETFFIMIGAEITKRKTYTVSAYIKHPDELAVHIKVKRYDFDEAYVEALRKSGDSLLFALIYKMLRSYDFGRGEAPKIYPGQLCPRVQFGPQVSPMMVPSLNLDTSLKRKHD